MHNLLAHHSSWDPAFFVTQFMEGLHRDIRAAVVQHRPQTLDTAVDLACLQEEVAEALRRDDKPTWGASFSSRSRAFPRVAFPLPPPPPAKPSGITPTPQQDDRRPPSKGSRSAAPDNKLGALRAYRRANGLCFTCGERWSHDHRCAPTVQLHVVEELIEMLQSPPQQADADEVPAGEADYCVLSKATLEGAESPTTMRLHGWVQGREVLMLIDSGSSHSFVSQPLAVHLSGVQPARTALTIRVADGGVLHNTQEIPACQWQSHGTQFTTNIKILPLGSYDVILGIDWLARHSPMNAHWMEKPWISSTKGSKFTSGGSSRCHSVSHDLRE